MNKDDALERLKQNSIIVPDSCWIYKGASINKTGHCQINIEGKFILVHRLSAHIHWGFDLDSPMWILHRVWCISPACWWPKHLYEGTSIDNVSDSIITQTHRSVTNSRKTHCPAEHEYTPENTRIGSKGERICRTCHREKSRARYYE